MQRMKKKLSSRKGETILETLVALLIIVLSISFLSGSIAKSASISHEIRKTTEDGFAYSKRTAAGSYAVTSTGEYVMSDRSAFLYQVKTEGGTFYYYVPVPSEVTP